MRPHHSCVYIATLLRLFSVYFDPLLRLFRPTPASIERLFGRLSIPVAPTALNEDTFSSRLGSIMSMAAAQVLGHFISERAQLSLLSGTTTELSATLGAMRERYLGREPELLQIHDVARRMGPY